jgi:hypothetical protein
MNEQKFSIQAKRIYATGFFATGIVAERDMTGRKAAAGI